MRIKLILKVSCLDNPGHFPQYCVNSVPLANQGSKGAQALAVAMRIDCSRSIKARGAEGRLLWSHFFRRDKNKFRFWIKKSLNEPASGGAIDPDVFASNPFHRHSPFRSASHLTTGWLENQL